jgi:hypothetical protein
MKETWILGIRLSDHRLAASKVQDVLTKYGCTIRTRLGLHDIVEEYVSPGGIILLELAGDINEFMKLENELLAIDGVTVRKMVF